MHRNGAIPTLNALKPVGKIRRSCENMHVMEHRIGKPIAQCTHVLDHDRQISHTVAKHCLYAILIVMEVLQGMQCFPAITIFVDNREISGLQSFPVEPTIKKQHRHCYHVQL